MASVLILQDPLEAIGAISFTIVEADNLLVHQAPLETVGEISAGVMIVNHLEAVGSISGLVVVDNPTIWPAVLPQLPIFPGYTETAPDGLLRSNIKSGLSRTRRAFTAAPTPFSFGVEMTPPELEYFDTYFNINLVRGVLRFQWNDAITGAVYNYRFLKVPTWVPFGPLNWLVSMEIERMP